MYKPVKLTKKTAAELVGKVFPRLAISKDNTTSDVAIFRASTGPDGLEIICENDWYDHNGRIRLWICDGGYSLVRYYHPETLERDYAAEEADKAEQD